jgi:hypothetical protein
MGELAMRAVDWAPLLEQLDDGRLLAVQQAVDRVATGWAVAHRGGGGPGLPAPRPAAIQLEHAAPSRATLRKVAIVLRSTPASAAASVWLSWPVSIRTHRVVLLLGRQQPLGSRRCHRAGPPRGRPATLSNAD